MKILLVEPEFPISQKSKNHKNFLPIGLLKLASYYKDRKHYVALVRGNKEKKDVLLKPDQILITSLFTYWRRYVKESVEHYRRLFPNAKIVVGGIYASLMPHDCAEYTGCDEVFIGVHKDAENCLPLYGILPDASNITYQIIHTSRGCIRHCEFCGARKIEPEFTYKKSIASEIRKNKIIFYDNNLLANPHIEGILKELANSVVNGRPITCESQCGFDGRLLTPVLAKLLKKARFINPRIAWDGPYGEYKRVEKQLNLLVNAGYRRRDIFVFMVYNWDLGPDEMEKKREKCKEWQVQISDCRYRLLDQLFDNYNPHKPQTSEDYYIHPKWTDQLIKTFRKNVRNQNICIRMGFAKYDKELEKRGQQHREIRIKLSEQLRDRGYDSVKVRQIIKEEREWLVNVRLCNEWVKVRLSSDYYIKSILPEKPASIQPITSEAKRLVSS